MSNPMNEINSEINLSEMNPNQENILLIGSEVLPPNPS